MTAVLIFPSGHYPTGGPKWVIVGRHIAGLSTEISPKRGERHAFICTLMKKWSEVSEKRAIACRPSQISSSKNTWRR